MAGPRWKTLPLISNSSGRVGDTVTDDAGHLERPGRHLRHHRDDALHQRLRPARRANDKTYTIADSDLGAILRVRETASNVGGETVGVVGALRRPGRLRPGRRRGADQRARRALRNAQGTTLALAKLSGAGSRAPARQEAKRAEGHAAPPGQVKGKLVAWACPATIERGRHAAAVQRQGHAAQVGDAAPPRDRTGKVRVVVVRADTTRQVRTPTLTNVKAE